MSLTITAETVCEDFRQAVSSIVDDADFLADIHLTGDSVIAKDLELDSVEVVRTFEYFLNKYDEAPLVGWFSEQSVEQLLAMTVEDLAVFLQQHYG